MFVRAMPIIMYFTCDCNSCRKKNLVDRFTYTFTAETESEIFILASRNNWLVDRGSNVCIYQKEH